MSRLVRARSPRAILSAVVGLIMGVTMSLGSVLLIYEANADTPRIIDCPNQPAGSDPNCLGHEHVDLMFGTGNYDGVRGFEAGDYIETRGHGDNVQGNKGGDFISGGDGSDSIDGNEDCDGVIAGPVGDAIHGLDDGDMVNCPDGTQGGLNGDQGDDGVHGNEGNDDLFGGYGNDLLDGGPGNDFCKGGPDSDTFSPTCEDVDPS